MCRNVSVCGTINSLYGCLYNFKLSLNLNKGMIPTQYRCNVNNMLRNG